MGREIKFKLWDKESFKMHYPDKGREWCFDDEYDSIHFGLEVKMFMSYRTEENAVLLQYTGLKDKNGLEIYEGDFLKDEENFLWEVFYENCGFRVRCSDLMAIHDISLYRFNFFTEIAGNIYEKSNLLGGNNV